MIRVSVLYPKSEGATFDHEYYRTKHVPMAVNGWKPARTEIDKGVDGPFEAAVHFFFESAERFQQCMGLPVTGGFPKSSLRSSTAPQCECEPQMSTRSFVGTAAWPSASPSTAAKGPHG